MDSYDRSKAEFKYDCIGIFRVVSRTFSGPRCPFVQ